MYLQCLTLNAFGVTDHQFNNVLLQTAGQVYPEQVSYNARIKEFSSYNTYAWECTSTVNRLPRMSYLLNILVSYWVPGTILRTE